MEKTAKELEKCGLLNRQQWYKVNKEAILKLRFQIHRRFMTRPKKACVKVISLTTILPGMMDENFTY